MSKFCRLIFIDVVRRINGGASFLAVATAAAGAPRFRWTR